MIALVIFSLWVLLTVFLVRRASGWAYQLGWNDALESVREYVRKNSSSPEQDPTRPPLE